MSELSEKVPEEGGNYVKFPDGTLIQWGRAQIGASGYASVDFTVPFIDTGYAVQATPEYASGTITFDVSVQRSSASRAIIYARTDAGAIVSGTNVNWTATGQWK